MGTRVPKTAPHQGNQLSMGTRVPAPHPKKGAIQKTLQVWLRKAKLQTSTTPSKPSSEKSSPKHHISWKGFAEPFEPVGEICLLCERDFAYAPNDYDSNAEYVSDLSNLPSVSVLPCGHAYHKECLQLDTPDEKARDPPCPICASIETF